jgi:hypothetical protein
VVVALVLSLRIASDEDGVHRLLTIVIVRERSMELGRRQVGILLDGLLHTIAMRHMIGDDVDHPMVGAVDAWDSAAVRSDMRISHVVMHLSLPQRVISAW